MMPLLPEPLQAARLWLAHRRPYLGAALWALTPVARPGLGTLAVDQWWRLYCDPAVCSSWSVEHLAGVLYHEICHLLRAHHERAEGWEASAANFATDAETNDDLLREGIPLPGEPVTPATIGQPEGLLAEEYYAALQAQQSASSQRPEAQGPHGPGGTPQAQGGADQDAVSADPSLRATGDQADPTQEPASASGAREPGAGTGSTSASTAARGGHASAPQADGGGDMPPSPPGDAGGSQSSASSGHGGVSSQPAARPVGNGRTRGHDGASSAVRTQTPAPGAGRCGSCATGHQEPWEDGPPGDGTAPGLSRAEADLIRRQVAEAIRVAAASGSRGNVPGHWRRWAEEKLQPRVDWRRELAAAVRHALADVAGAADYSYRRPSRRQAVSEAILPSLRQPVPEVAVVVDTSESIDECLLAQALAEVAGVLRACGLRQGIHVLAVDAQVQACRRVVRPEQVRLAGGGGTDMGMGLSAAARLRPRPQVIIVLTDGMTPWPDAPPARTRVVVGLLADQTAPAWARAVRITQEGL